MDSGILPSVSATDAEHVARHRWYFFKEAFSPAIVEHAIEDADLRTGALVFDPFSGSGTTPLQAGLSGLQGAGTEVNPFLRFVARTKASKASVPEFNAALEVALKGARRGAASPLAKFSTFTELAPAAVKRGKWLFNSAVLRTFEGGYRCTRNEQAPAYDLVRLCLIGAAMDSANAVKDGKCLRYRSNWSNLSLGPEDFMAALTERIKVVREDLAATGDLPIDADIQLGDSRRTGSPSTFDLCVTSPPYLNSFDYTDVYRPELFIGGFVQDMVGLRQLRIDALRSHVQASWAMPTRTNFGTQYSESMAQLLAVEKGRVEAGEGLWNRRLPIMIQAYFEDMESVLKALRRQAKPHASVWLVVSTSAYAGVEFPVDLIIADIAGRCGWFLREVAVLRHLKRVAGQQWTELSQREGVSGPHLRESVVILDASPRRRP